MTQEIVLVEDNPDHGELALKMLKEVANEAEVTWIKDGQEALDYLLNGGSYEGEGCKNPALILLDIKMPKLNGIEVLKKLKNRDGLRRIPVVMFTTSSDPKDIEDAYRLGANSFVTKSIRFSELKRCVQEIGSYWFKVNTSPNLGDEIADEELEGK